MLKPLQSELLNSIPGIRHAFFTRQGGVSSGPFDSLNCRQKSPENIMNITENRRRVANWFGDNIQLLMPFQVHENDILVADPPYDPQQLPRCDGLVTDKPGHVVGVITADCVPILLCDPLHKVVAAVHAGWRGTAKDIVFNAVNQIVSQGGSLKNIIAAIGPSIQQPSYQVDYKVYDVFADKKAGYEQFFQTDVDDRFLFDLPGMVYHQLQQAGVARIDWLKWDTYTNPELFFSCRRSIHNGQQFFGAMLTGIMLEE